MTGHARHVHGRGASHSVCSSLDQRVKSQRCVKPVLEAAGVSVFPDLVRLLHRNRFDQTLNRISIYNTFTQSKR